MLMRKGSMPTVSPEFSTCGKDAFLHLGSVVRKLDSAIHRIVIFQPSQKGIKSSDTKNIDLARNRK